jgi:hypothetical protein
VQKLSVKLSVDFLGGVSRTAKAGFDVAGGLVGEAARIGLEGGTKEMNFKPGELLKTGVDEAKKTITTPGSEGIFWSWIQRTSLCFKSRRSPSCRRA